MKTSLLALLGGALLLSGALQAAPPFNFTVSSFKDDTSEGPDRMRSCFSLGRQRIAFMPPPHCEVTGTADSLSFLLTNEGLTGQIIVANSALPPDLDFAVAFDRYHEAALATLPADAEKVEAQPATSALYHVNDWKTLTFEFAYSFHGHRMHRQITYLDFDREHQITVQVVGDESIWSKATGTATRFMHSWFVIDEPKTAFR